MSKRTMLSLGALLGLLVVGFFSIVTVMPPSVRAADAPADEFSAARAFAHVQHVGDSVHVAGTPAADSVREYLLSTLKGFGLDPQVQDTIGVSKEDKLAPGAAHVRNVVAVIPGTQPTKRVFLVAHYDSVQNGPGANDDGAGVSAILETARALTQGAKPRNDIVLVFTEAEEACLCGAHAFVDQHPLAKDGGVVLNVEARGASGPAIMFETSTGNSDVVKIFGDSAPYPVGTSFAVEVYRILPNDTDFSPFRDSKSFSGLNTAYIDGHDAYHQAQDTPQRMDQRSLQHHGDNLLAVTRAFGAEDLTDIAKPGSLDATYFPAVGVLISYPGYLVWPLAGLSLLAVLAYAWLAVRKGRTTVRRELASTGLALLPIIGTVLVAQLFWVVLTKLQPGMANMIDPWQPVWHRWALVLLVVTVVLGWYVWLRRRLDAHSLAVGALAWLAIFALLMAAAVPGGSYLTALPALFGALAAIIALLASGQDESQGQVVAFIARLIAGIVAVVILAPTVTLFFPALGLATGAAPALFAVLLGLALVPLLDGLPGLKWALRSAAFAALVLTLVGLLINRPSATQPIPAQLMYALDADTGKAVWLSSESVLSDYTAQFAPNAGEAPGFPMLHPKWTGPAERADLPASKVTREGTKVTIVPQRRLDLVYVKLEGDAKIVSVGGQPIGAGELLFYAPPATGIELTLSTDAPAGMRVLDGSYGLVGLPGYPKRPDDVTALGSHSSDVVLVGKTYR